MGFLDKVPEAPSDPIFGLVASFQADPRPEKVNYITGYFLGEDLQIPSFAAVKEVEKMLAEQKKNLGYLPIEGDKEFVTEIGQLVFGSSFEKEKILGVQTLGGTGALFLAGVIAAYWTDLVAIPDPTWVNHWTIFPQAGLKVESYPYYLQRKLRFDLFLDKLKTLPKNTCVVLHTNCQNPTGYDLSKKQWEELSALMQQRELFPLFDMAYQGFSDTCEADAFAPRLFLERGHEFALAYSCSKNFSLYGERVGALFYVAPSAKIATKVTSRLKAVIRSVYSNPPTHGERIVKTILQTKTLRKSWEEQLAQMRKRMQSSRTALVEALCAKDPEGGWEYLQKATGLFCYPDLSKHLVEKLREKYAIYLPVGGRINSTGLNGKNLPPLVEALIQVTKHS